MRRVVWTAAAVVVGDGVLLGASMALGWTVLVVLAALVGIGGAVLVARGVPAPRVPARPATVTLGVPMRETASASEPAAGTTPAVELPTVSAPAPVAA